MNMRKQRLIGALLVIISGIVIVIAFLGTSPEDRDVTFVLFTLGVEILVYKIAGYYFDADIYAIKLERGGVQTLAHQDSSGNWVLNEVPDYGEELLKCIQSTADSADTYANKTIATTDYAVNKAGDTMAGALVAHNDTDYSTYKIRNAAILSATPSSMTNGTVAFVYK